MLKCKKEKAGKCVTRISRCETMAYETGKKKERERKRASLRVNWFETFRRREAQTR